MNSFPLVLASIGLTVVSWGVYGPLMREGQAGMKGSHLLPFICVGIAYFLIAVLVPGLLLRARGETGRWTMAGAIWSLAAGAVGAIGALGIILAFTNQGSPIYVMPLVFGGAPVVNTVLTMWMSGTFRQINPKFLVGLALVVGGAGAVLLFSPAAKAAQDIPAGQLAKVLGFVLLTALSWGVYGPVLHKGQMAMQGSRLRPFLCVGLAYFVVAVLVPLGLLTVIEDHGKVTPEGTFWSLGGGTAGALGALGIVLAFNFGGKPVYVMPLVFGGAPVVNTLTSIFVAHNLAQPSVLFFLGLLTVAAGAVMVLIFAPKAGHKPAAPHV